MLDICEFQFKNDFEERIPKILALVKLKTSST